jgi:hypothetical protein
VTIHPRDIDPEQQRLLTERAKRSGRSEAELLREALAEYLAKDQASYSWIQAQEESFVQAWDNDEDSVLIECRPEDVAGDWI